MAEGPGPVLQGSHHLLIAYDPTTPGTGARNSAFTVPLDRFHGQGVASPATSHLSGIVMMYYPEDFTTNTAARQSLDGNVRSKHINGY
jgi:hypothetical protein